METYIESIKKVVPLYYENDTELRIRCPFCGDSQKHPTHAHLYISKYLIPGYNIPMFNCFRCGASGSVNKLLRHFKLPVSQIDKNAITEIKEVAAGNDFWGRKEFAEYKLQYLRNRLDEDIPGFVMPYLADSFRTRSPIFSQYLNKHYVGFITHNRRKCACRLCTDDKYLNRYVMINKTSLPDFFVLEPSSNEYTKKGTIVIAEGAITLIRGYLSLRKLNILNKRQVLLIASFRKNSLSSAFKYATSYFGIPDWETFVLADEDVNPKIINFKSKILYNKNGSDFGEKCTDIKILEGGLR